MSSEIATMELYATAVGELWSRVTPTLGRLDAIAARPELVAEDALLPALRRLQYSLHVAAEGTVSVTPPPDAAAAHEELVAALEAARDATGEIAEAVELAGADGLRPHLYEWRGALFRVRLARMRLEHRRRQETGAGGKTPGHLAPGRSGRGGIRAPLAATLLVLAGAGLFVVGAVSGIWPLWAAGIAAVAVSAALPRPV